MKILDGVNILYVEDEEDYSEVVGKELRRHGCIVTDCRDGNQLFKALKGFIPDIIILDVNLPGENGLNLSKKLKEVEAYSKIPIVFLTAATTKSSSTKYSALVDVEDKNVANVIKTYGSNVHLFNAIKKLLNR